MAKGQGHDRFNRLLGVFILVGLFFLNLKWILLVSFFIGWLLSTYYLSPDLDIAPRGGKLFKLLFYPYAIFFKHRGISHSLIVGTLTRVLYLLVVVGGVLFLLERFEVIDYQAEDYYTTLVRFLKNFDSSLAIYQCLIWFLVGMIGADISHIVVDKVLSFLNRVL